MKLRFIISTLLLVTCFAAFGQEKQSDTEKHNSGGVKGLVKVSIMYPYAEGKTFNMEYYGFKPGKIHH
jgi:hypothetical protein